MASFSFGAGNAAKLLRIPLYVLGRVATWVIPRSRHRWVFGSAAGIADGALALWLVAQARGDRGLWMTEDSTQDAEATRRGIPTVRKGSWAGFWYTARAGVIVVTHGFGDVNRYATHGAFLVQLWHGIPLKRIGLDSPATDRAPLPFLRPIVRRLYRMTQRRISLIPAASHLVRGRLESAFDLPDDRVPVTGEPRVDVLSRGTAEERSTRARALVEAAVGDVGAKSLVLYAPTWRDGADDPVAPSRAQWERTIEVLEEHDAVLLVRSHPLGAGDYMAGVGERVRMIGSDLVADITPLLPSLSVLITDYSSLVFDASLVPVPTVLLAPDVQTYARERGFYGEYRDVSAGAEAATWMAAIAQVTSILDDTDRAERTAWAVAVDHRMHAFRDGFNTQRVYDEIARRREGSRP